MYCWTDSFIEQLMLNYPATAKLTDAANVFDIMDVLLMEQKGSA